MKTKTLIMLALVLALVLAASAPRAASADEAVVPFKASYATAFAILGVDSNGCNIQRITGVGQATHMGESTLYSDAVGCPATQTQTGSLLFTAADGDELWGTFAGKLRLEFPIVYFWGNYVMTDGSGRFDENTGAGSYTGSANLLTGTGTITFEGELYK